MKLAPKKDEKTTDCCAPGCCDDQEKYPWGLRLNLGDEELQKLGITDLPKVGTVIAMQCQVKVTGVRSNESQDGENRNLELQVTDCGMDMGKGVDMEKKASNLYGGEK